MKITEDVLKELGFIQQNPPTIWDYPLHGKIGYGEQMCRVCKQHYGNKNDWYFEYGKNSLTLVTSVMDLVRIVAIFAHANGVKETQDKLHDALGLNRLVEAVVDAATRDN